MNPLRPDQLELIAELMHSPDWYMNGAELPTSHELYYKPWLTLNWCCFDLETTNLLFLDEEEKTVRDDGDDTGFHTVQFYGENWYNREMFESHEQLINPLAPIPEESSKIHGIYDKDVVGMPDFASAWPEIAAMLDPVDGLVAFNGDRFDIPGLMVDCVRHDIPVEEFEPVINKPHINLLIWEKERKGLMTNNTLKAIAKRFGVKMMGRVEHGKENLHDARVDVKAMAELLIPMSENANMPFIFGELVRLQAKFAKKHEDYHRKKREAAAKRRAKKKKQSEQQEMFDE